MSNWNWLPKCKFVFIHRGIVKSTASAIMIQNRNNSPREKLLAISEWLLKYISNSNVKRVFTNCKLSKLSNLSTQCFHTETSTLFNQQFWTTKSCFPCLIVWHQNSIFYHILKILMLLISSKRGKLDVSFF